MSITLQAITVPLRDDGHGGLRVGSTRVTFESVWHLNQQGASTADIVQAFDTLDPADVHAVLAWALRHLDDVDAYLNRRNEEAAEMRNKLEQGRITPTADERVRLRERLLAKWQDLKTQRADDASLSDG
jgi:uncharacterized protein (DUF433 family)